MTTQKHKKFVDEPMGEKKVTELAGIGDALGKKLNTAGFERAYMVFGQYLSLGKNEQRFTSWLHATCRANTKQQNDCYQCLRVWCGSFFL